MCISRVYRRLILLFHSLYWISRAVWRRAGSLVPLLRSSAQHTSEITSRRVSTLGFLVFVSRLCIFVKFISLIIDGVWRFRFSILPPQSELYKQEKNRKTKKCMEMSTTHNFPSSPWSIDVDYKWRCCCCTRLHFSKKRWEIIKW